MKRLLAILALLMGLTAIIPMAQARMCMSTTHSELMAERAADEGGGVVSERAHESDPRARRIARDRALGRADRGPRTVLVPTIMLDDRPLE